MVPTIFAVRRPTQAVHSLIRSSGLNCVIESLSGFWKVGRVHECLPTTPLKILQSHAAVVQKALTDMGRFTIGPRRPEEAWYRINDLAELVFAFPKGLLCALELFNIQIHPHPLQQGSIARPERFDASEEPAVASLSVTNSKTKLSGLARAQTG